MFSNKIFSIREHASLEMDLNLKERMPSNSSQRETLIRIDSDGGESNGENSAVEGTGML